MKAKKLTALLLLFALFSNSLAAQTQAQADTREQARQADDRENWPQWMRNLRRWEIVAFGSIPFTMFFTTIGMDLYRWQRESGMDWQQRQYAPWPIKSSGAVPMTDGEIITTISIAAALSAAIAIADYFIVRGIRRREAQRAEILQPGSIVITRVPLTIETVVNDEPLPRSEWVLGTTRPAFPFPSLATLNFDPPPEDEP